MHNLRPNSVFKCLIYFHQRPDDANPLFLWYILRVIMDGDAVGR